jgi:deoxyribodipyrimidine photo-lyase
MTAPGVQVVWFKRDVRLFDHAPLQAAVAACAESGQRLLCLYIIEPALWQQPDMASRHWAFLAESLRELADDLRQRGQTLCVQTGETVRVLDTLHQQHGVAGVWSHMETGNGWTFARDRRVSAWAKAQGVPWRESQPFGVWRGSVRIRCRPSWGKDWETWMRQPLRATPETLPAAPEGVATADIPAALPWLVADPCPRRQPGGRRAGLALLSSFFAGRGSAYHTQLSSPLTARKACSRWSVHLAYGTLSLREVVQRCLAEVANPLCTSSERRAYRAVLSRLHWHCHFIQKLEDAPSMEHTALHPAMHALRPTTMDADTQARFTAWASGRTGWPLVDATMAELQATGWITFRMRAMLVSVATVHLWLPWQPVALHLARLFTDYEPGIHYQQVQMQSGATGMNTVRAYNPTKQGLDQDPDGTFVRAWLPALAAVPTAQIHTPWLLSEADQAACDCVIGVDYPAPLVDETAARKAGVARLYLPRKEAVFRHVRDQLVVRHSGRGMGSKQPAKPTNAALKKPPRTPEALPLFAALNDDP